MISPIDITIVADEITTVLITETITRTLLTSIIDIAKRSDDGLVNFSETTLNSKKKIIGITLSVIILMLIIYGVIYMIRKKRLYKVTKYEEYNKKFHEIEKHDFETRITYNPRHEVGNVTLKDLRLVGDKKIIIKKLPQIDEEEISSQFLIQNPKKSFLLKEINVMNSAF